MRRPPTLVQRPPRAAGPAADQRATRFATMFSALRGVRWSVSYLAVLVYIVVITTYVFAGIGMFVMIAALAAVALEARLRITPVLAILGAFIIWAFAIHFVSPWPATSMVALEVIGKVWLVVLVATATLTDRKRVRLFMLVFVAAFALYPARGTLFNYFLGGYTVFGRAVWNYIYRNSNDLAALTLLQVSTAAAIFVAEPRGWYKRGALAALIVLPIVVLLTQSRGAFLGLVIFVVLAFTTQRRKLRLIGFALMVGAAAFVILPESALERFGMVRTIGAGGSQALGELDDQGSAQQRYEIWQTGWRIIRDNPITGVGYGNYPTANGVYSPRLGNRDAHSTYFSLMAEVGIPGFLLFVSLVGVVIWRAERTRRAVQELDPALAQQIRYLELGLASFLVAGVFASYARLTFLYVHMVLIWALAELAQRQLRAARAVPRRGG